MLDTARLPCPSCRARACLDTGGQDDLRVHPVRRRPHLRGDPRRHPDHGDRWRSGGRLLRPRRATALARRPAVVADRPCQPLATARGADPRLVMPRLEAPRGRGSSVVRALVLEGADPALGAAVVSGSPSNAGSSRILLPGQQPVNGPSGASAPVVSQRHAAGDVGVRPPHRSMTVRRAVAGGEPVTGLATWGWPSAGSGVVGLAAARSLLLIASAVFQTMPRRARDDQSGKQSNRPDASVRPLTCANGARGRIRTDDLSITRPKLGVRLHDAGRILPAQVGCRFGLVGS
jgi:hypothetical protein